MVGGEGFVDESQMAFFKGVNGILISFAEKITKDDLILNLELSLLVVFQKNLGPFKGGNRPVKIELVCKGFSDGVFFAPVGRFFLASEWMEGA